jgi:DNA repair exonuclease SbcCD ATPase subunit
MQNRGMKRSTISRAQRREAFLALAGQAFDELETWYDAHPEASFAEIEAKAREVRQALMGKGLELLINQRIHAVELHAPRCPTCGQPMRFKGRLGKQVSGLEGQSRIERNYYVCPNGCGQTAFPPGSCATPESGSLE